MLPNFSQDSFEANYSLPINWLLTFVSISLYGIFLRGQVGRYRNLFIESNQPLGSGTCPWETALLTTPRLQSFRAAS